MLPPRGFRHGAAERMFASSLYRLARTLGAAPGARASSAAGLWVSGDFMCLDPGAHLRCPIVPFSIKFGILGSVEVARIGAAHMQRLALALLCGMAAALPLDAVGQTVGGPQPGPGASDKGLAVAPQAPAKVADQATADRATAAGPADVCRE